MISLERVGWTPAQLLEELKAREPNFWQHHVEPHLDELDVPTPKALGLLERHPSGKDPNELIKDRFLCRGGACLLVGPTGVGKSSFAMQCCLLWSLGRPVFDLVPARPLRILLVQAENDEGDLAEMRDGVLQGLKFGTQEASEALARVHVLHEDSCARQGFVKRLSPVLRDGGYDLLVIDPLLAYLGGDANEQRDVSGFLRNMINPLLRRYNVGLLLVHHVNKPPTGREKPEWRAGEFAYLGSGSAEFANWARAVLAIRCLGSETVYELRACKRGRRLPWQDRFGRHTVVQYISYHTDRGTICWRKPDAVEMQAAVPDNHESIMQDIVNTIGESTTIAQTDLVSAIQEWVGCQQRKARLLITEALEAGVIRVVRVGHKNERFFGLTGKLKPVCTRAVQTVQTSV